MLIRRIANRGSLEPDLEQKQPKRRRAGLYVLSTIAAGIVAGLAAGAGVWPFSGFQGAVTHVAYSAHAAGSEPIQASTIFQEEAPVHKVIDVYDPPPQHAQPVPTLSAARPTPHPHPSLSASPRIQSSPSPSPDN